MIAFVLAFAMMASPAAERPIPPAAAAALRAASEAAGGLESRATSGSPDVRAAVLSRVHRWQEEAGLWADAAATAGRMATGVTGSHGRVTWARSLARAGALDEAAAIAATLKGEARDQVLVVLAAERARTDLGAARAIAAELGARADAPAAWAEIGSARATTGGVDGAVAAFAEAARIAKLIPESSGFLVGRTVSRSKALDDIADRQVKAGRLDDALATVELLKAVPPTFGAGPADVTRAWAGRRADLLRAAGRLDEAGQALEAATDPPVDAVVALAEAYGRAGTHDRAARGPGGAGPGRGRPPRRSTGWSRWPRPPAGPGRTTGPRGGSARPAAGSTRWATRRTGCGHSPRSPRPRPGWARPTRPARRSTRPRPA